jgi:hypothetical protein
LTSLLAWQQGWRPKQALAWFRGDIAVPYFPNVRVNLPQLPLQLVAPAKSDHVVMVDSAVFETPQSQAYTADLYKTTGKDIIPWPNIDGRTKVELYTVQPGDSLWGIAAGFGLDLDTLRWSNPELERNPDVLSVDTELRILPVQGVYHLVAAGDTIESIAAQYGVAPEDISHYPPNALFPPYNLAKIEGLIIPFGRKDISVPKPALAPDYAIAWPLVGTVTGTFDATHPGIDIGAPYGTIVYAVEGGTITYAGWAYDGFGYLVIIDHGDGRQSWYHHLKGALLQSGAVVTRGTPVGEVGSTGHSTGPHLHLELHVNGERVDPLNYLSNTPQ